MQADARAASQVHGIEDDAPPHR